MKRRFTTILLAVLVLICMTVGVCACSIDTETPERITTVEEQVTSINSSITDLKATDTELKGYIDTLKSSVTTLEGEVDDIDEKIEELEQINNNFGASLTGILQEFNKLKVSVTSDIETINGEIATLDEQRLELDVKISNLESLADTLASKEWTEATFATLEQYEIVQSDISEIKTDISLINTNMNSLYENMMGEIDDINETIETLATSDELKDEILSITTAYTEAIQTAKNDIVSAYTEAIDEAIKKSESGMKTWVNETLANGYYTISQIDAKLDALVKADEALSNDIDEQKTALATARNELTEAYKQAIENAINKHNGEITAKIDDINADLNAKIDDINAELAKITEQVNTNKENIQDILDRLDALEEENEALKNQINCLKGIHEYDKTQITYDWGDNWATCSYSKPCKHCDAETGSGTVDISYADFKLTATFNQKDNVEPAVLDITNATNFTNNEIKRAINYMIGDGEADSVDVKLTLASDADSDVFTAIVEALESAKDGSVNLTLSGVEKIPEKAFEQCTKLASVTLGSGIKTIEINAFTQSSLTSVTIGTDVVSIGELAFSQTAITEINIPDNVISLGDTAFGGCTSLSRVTLGKGLTTIPEGAFYQCTALESITIPSNITTIDDMAFVGTGLTSIVIPDTVTSLGGAAFSDCVALSSVSIGSGITTIEVQTFAKCSALTSITIPSTITSIEKKAFSSSGLTSVVVPDSVTTLGENVFSSCESLTNITIGSGVTKMEANVFNGATALTEIIFRGAITEADDGIFRNLTTENVTLKFANGQKILAGGDEYNPWTATENLFVSGNTFCDCTFKEIIPTFSVDATSMTNTELKTKIEEFITAGARNITVKLAKNNATSAMFQAIVNGISGAEDGSVSLILEGDIEIFRDAFCSCTAIKSITIPASVTSIPDSAFQSCSYLTSVVFEQNSKLESIGEYAFQSCKALTDITIPASVTSIGTSAFDNCSALKTVTFEDGSKLESIGEMTFYQCKALTNITIPASVTSIGASAFERCTALASVTFCGKKLGGVSDNAFGGCSALTRITFTDRVNTFNPNMFGSVDVSGVTLLITREQTVLEGSGSNYVESYYSTFLTDDTTFCNLTFKHIYVAVDASGYTHIQEDDFQSDIESLCEKGFRSFYVIFPNNNRTYKFFEAAKTAFDNKTEDGSVSLYISGTAGVTEIASQTFQSCDKLKSVAVGEGITTVCDYAFRYCDYLVSVTLEEGVKSIEVGAFASCTALTTVYVPHSLTSIKNYAFNACRAITDFNYNGTLNELASIKKGVYWKSSDFSITVKCTDGDQSY